MGWFGWIGYNIRQEVETGDLVLSVAWFSKRCEGQNKHWCAKSNRGKRMRKIAKLTGNAPLFNACIRGQIQQRWEWGRNQGAQHCQGTVCVSELQAGTCSVRSTGDAAGVVERRKQVQHFGCCIWILETEKQLPVLVQPSTGETFMWMLVLVILSTEVDADLHKVFAQRTYISCIRFSSCISSYLRCCWTCSGEIRFRPQFVAPELNSLVGAWCISSHHNNFI